MKNYVVGFMFSEDRREVLLIHKQRPEWQKDRFNGIGGKVEFDETPVQALIREFKEETGLTTDEDQWTPVVCYYKPEFYQVNFFKAISNQLREAQSLTDEDVKIVQVRRMPSNLIYNLRWIIPLCLDKFVWFRGPIKILGE